MQNFDPVLETRILKTVLDSKTASLYTVLNNDWFGMPTAKEIWGRIHNLRVNGKSMPTSQTLATDPVLSQNAQTLLRGELRPYEFAEVENAVTQLDTYRQWRNVYGMLDKMSDLISAKDTTVEDARREIELCLRKMQAGQYEDEVLAYGPVPEETLAFYEAALEKDVSTQFVRTGYSAIDSMQGGLGRGRVYILGAESGGGKSILANNIAINAYHLDNKSVGYFSFELDREECMWRTQANIAKIPHERFSLKTLTPADRKKSDTTLAKFLAHGAKNQCRLDYWSPSRDLDITEVFAQAEVLNYDMVIIDYINLMRRLDPKRPMWENLGEELRLAKRFAQRTQKIVVVLVQIDEETGSIKYAKSIKHHADGIWIWEKPDPDKDMGITTIDQVKLRNFKPMTFQLQAEFEFCRFTDIPLAAQKTQDHPAASKAMNL